MENSNRSRWHVAVGCCLALAAAVGAANVDAESFGLTGAVTEANSLVGTTANDASGSRGVVVVSSGRRIVAGQRRRSAASERTIKSVDRVLAPFGRMQCKVNS